MDDSRDRLVRKGDYVYGSFLRSEQIDGYINGVNPGDRSDVLGRFSSSEASVEDAVDHARLAAKVWRRVGLNDRSAAIRRFRQAVSNNHERLVRLITRETGKPTWDARSEVVATLQTLDHLLDEGVKLLAPRVLENAPGRSDWMPRGVVALLCPFNMPVRVPAVNAATAVLGGNTVIFKPSKFAPGVGQLVAELWDQSRLPRGVVNMIQGSGSGVGRKLITHPDIDAAVLVGSFSTAMDVRRSIFDRPGLPVVYRAGGKALAIVLDGCEMERAVYEVLTGAFRGCGQHHRSTGRVIVQESVFDAFSERLVEAARELSVGYGFDDDVFMGPLISENSRSRFRRYGRALVSKGATPLLEAGSAGRTARRGFYVTPGIYEVDWRGGNAFLNDEPPGPMTLLYRVKSGDEALALHNQALFRSVCSVFPGPRTDLPDLVDRLRSGTVLLNRATTTETLPLSPVGLGRAGNALPDGTELVHALCHPRAQFAESRPFDPSTALPGTPWGSDEDPVTEEEPYLEVDDPSEDAEMDVSSMLEPM